jgi:hypothetical protein
VERKLYGVRGWLLVVLLGWLACGVLAGDHLARNAGLWLDAGRWYALTQPNGAAYHPRWELILWARLASDFLAANGAVFLGILLLQRRRATRVWAPWYFLLVLTIVWQEVAVTRDLPGGVLQSPFSANVWREWQSPIAVVCAAGSLYFYISRRARLTLGR